VERADPAVADCVAAVTDCETAWRALSTNCMILAIENRATSAAKFRLQTLWTPAAEM
jgi:hypothetical protein